MIGPITGIIASNVSIVREYFTTVLYPFAVTDELTIPNAAFGATPGNLWTGPYDVAGISNPTIESGSLIPSIVYQTYTTQIEDFAITSPDIQSGSLIPTIVYQTYTTQIEDFAITSPDIQSGSLVVTISYVNYTTGATENMSVENPSILSGTLL